MTKFSVDVAGGGSPEELRPVPSDLPQMFTFAGDTIEGVLENVAELFDAIFEMNLARSVTGPAADLQRTRSEQDAFISEQVAEWFSIHRPQALKDSEAVLRRYVGERR